MVINKNAGGGGYCHFHIQAKYNQLRNARAAFSRGGGPPRALERREDERIRAGNLSRGNSFSTHTSASGWSAMDCGGWSLCCCKRGFFFFLIVRSLTHLHTCTHTHTRSQRATMGQSEGRTVPSRCR